MLNEWNKQICAALNLNSSPSMAGKDDEEVPDPISTTDISETAEEPALTEQEHIAVIKDLFSQLNPAIVQAQGKGFSSHVYTMYAVWVG